MKYEEFTVQIKEAQKKADRLREYSLSVGTSDLLPQAIEELMTSHEELRVADEELHQQQEELLTSYEVIESERHRYEELFEFAPVVYLVTDADGIITESNQAATQMLGVTRRFLARKPLTAYVASDDRKVFRELLLRLRHVPRVQDFTLRLRPRRGGILDAALTASTMRDPLGRLTGIRWMIRDITAQTQAQEKIRCLNDELWELNRDLERRVAERAQALNEAHRAQDEAYALLQTLLSAADVGVAFFDAGAKYWRVNDAFAQMIGVAPDALIGTRCGEACPERSPIAMDHLRGVVDTRAQKEEVETTTASFTTPGEICTWLSSYYPVMLKDELIGVGVVVLDITDRKSAETKVVKEYEREHRIAQALQRSLLAPPPPSALSRLSIETFYEPALDEALVGGDFYDAIPMSDGRVALVVGDVAGKGLAAAEQMTVVKHSLRAFLWSEPSPARALSLLNDFLCDAQRHGRWDPSCLVTVGVAVLDSATGEGVYGNGGAEPLVIVRVDEASRFLGAERPEAAGMLLGVDPGVTFEETRFRLGPSDWLTLVTDGVTEARRGPEMLGDEGLLRLAQEAASYGTLRERGQYLLRQTHAFAGGALSDDACLLLAQLNSRKE